MTLGDRNSGREEVQSLDNHIGKVVRIDRDGSVPADNPYLGQAGALPEIWRLAIGTSRALRRSGDRRTLDQ